MEAAAATVFNPVVAPRILIVDDDLELAAQLEVALRRHGFESMVVSTRAAALDRAGTVDLVLIGPLAPRRRRT